MFIKDLNKTPVTIYNKVGNRFIKTIIEDCVWKSSVEVSFKSQGALPLDSVKLYIPNYEGYVSADEYEGFGWTITTGSEKDNTYIVKGICDYDFTSKDERELANQVREFEKSYDYHRANAIKENFFGGRRMRHLMVLC